MIHQQIFIEDKDATGCYVCAACGHPLFEASKKFDAGCWFPSFWNHKPDAIIFNALSTYGRDRTQLLCQHCGAHLGHLFQNKITPTKRRYCIAKEAIRLTE